MTSNTFIQLDISDVEVYTSRTYTTRTASSRPERERTNSRIFEFRHVIIMTCSRAPVRSWTPRVRPRPLQLWSGSRPRVVVSRAEGAEASVVPAASTWNHVMLFLLDANAQHLSSDSKSALSVAAGLAMASGKLTVVFLDDGAAGGQAEADRGEMKSALEALGLSEVSILEEQVEDKGKGSVAVGEAADSFLADLVVVPSAAVHDGHLDANLLVEFVPAPP